MLFVIDVAKSMFEKDLETNEELSPFDIIMKTLEGVFREKIRRSIKDLVSSHFQIISYQYH